MCENESRVHPSEIDLARWGELDSETGEEGASLSAARGTECMAEHLRWCGRCRSVVADHRWLQKEVAATLAAASDAVPVPRPRWWAVQEAMLTSQRRQVRGWWLSAIASVVSAVCLMLSVSPMFGTAAVAARVVSPEAVVATAPDTVPARASAALFPLSSLATPTPAMFHVQEVTPALVLPPTPAQPEI
jgi:hypothetical protein